MFSVKHVGEDGKENIVSVESVRFNAKALELTGYGPRGPGGTEGEEVIKLTEGHVYVMNEQGRTVGVYSLRK